MLFECLQPCFQKILCPVPITKRGLGRSPTRKKAIIDGLFLITRLPPPNGPLPWNISGGKSLWDMLFVVLQQFRPALPRRRRAGRLREILAGVAGRSLRSCSSSKHIACQMLLGIICYIILNGYLNFSLKAIKSRVLNLKNC